MLSTFTIQGFKKSESQEAQKSVADTQGSRLASFQSKIFSKKQNEEEKKKEESLSDLNVIERLMFNVQTSDLIDESRTSQKYSSAVDAQLQEMQKTLLFAYIEG